MLQAGYLEDWVWHATRQRRSARRCGLPDPLQYLSGQVGQFVENVLIPEYTRGTGRAPNPDYQKWKSSSCARADAGTAQRFVRCASSGVACRARTPMIRATGGCATSGTADDHLLGFTGPKAEAEEIKIRLAAFLREELKLELSQEKTLITHARTGAARFLGYEITVQHADHKVTGKGRSINGSDRPTRAPRRDQGQVRPLPQARQTRAAQPDGQRGRPHDRQDLRRAVPGHGGVLPAGRRRLPTEPAGMGR